jgi:hypothetical protein
MEGSNVHDLFSFVAIKLICFHSFFQTLDWHVKELKSLNVDYLLPWRESHQVIASAEMVLLRRKLGFSMKSSPKLPGKTYPNYFGRPSLVHIFINTSALQVTHIAFPCQPFAIPLYQGCSMWDSLPTIGYEHVAIQDLSLGISCLCSHTGIDVEQE